MEFKDKVVIVTGGANGIGKTISECFKSEGATVLIIDKVDGDHYIGDISQKDVLERFAETVIGRFGHVDILINNAIPQMKGIDDCSWEDFEYSLKVGVTAPFYLTKLFMPYFS